MTGSKGKVGSRLAIWVVAATFSSILGQKALADCNESTLVARFDVVRTWPAQNGLLPADSAIVIDMVAPSIEPEHPDQPIEIMTYKAAELSPLPPNGGIYGVTPLRSDYGTTRYVGGFDAHWSPSEWDDDAERHLVLIVQFFGLDESGNAYPVELAVGEAYTFRMEIADPDGGVDDYEVFELAFTAGEPLGDADGGGPEPPFVDIETETSCEFIQLECTTTEDCLADCEEAGLMQRTAHVLTSPSDALDSETPLRLDYKVEDYPFTFVSVRFPDDPPPAHLITLNIYEPVATSVQETCATLEVKALSGAILSTDAVCADVASAAELCDDVSTEPDPPDGGGGERAIAEPDPPGDESSDPGETPPRSGDASGATATGPIEDGADGSGVKPGDASAFAIPTGVSVADDDGCGCHLGDDSLPRAFGGFLTIALLALFWFHLRRRIA